MSYSLLFQKSYELVKWIYPAVNKFPKSQRLVLSQRIENTSIKILEAIISLSYKDSKLVRKQILFEIQKLQILMRISKDLSFLDFKKYEYISSLMKEISDLLDKTGGGGPMQTYRNLYNKLCSFENLHIAFRKAKRNKGFNLHIAEFELNLEAELFKLKHELETTTYEPRPLRQFPIREPKTRLISASHFRDRVVHHALCNVIETIFDKTFIYDSYANRKFKGTLAAVLKFDEYKRKVSGNGRLLPDAKDNNQVFGYALKADIRHYFDTVDHEILIRIIERKIKDEKVLWLIKKILDNHVSELPGKGMPIGNLTSQFFANIYLNELDYFVKHKLKAKHYIRYVDDFMLLNPTKQILEEWKNQINGFLKNNLKLDLHPEKSKVMALQSGTKFLGFRVFYKYKLLKKSNIRRMKHRINDFIEMYMNGLTDKIEILDSIDGWEAYAMHANTYKMRKQMNKKMLRVLDAK